MAILEDWKVIAIILHTVFGVVLFGCWVATWNVRMNAEADRDCWGRGGIDRDRSPTRQEIREEIDKNKQKMETILQNFKNKGICREEALEYCGLESYKGLCREKGDTRQEIVENMKRVKREVERRIQEMGKLDRKEICRECSKKLY